ncbi:MAG: Arm DNA-binding domain-containing protein [Sphingobium sp.]|jgi:hypothetical protein|nr:Arm DNA-binding domain-containing protein [Sphingobium sp.]MCI1270758.1 Arm DNA-binding domain-containing protein [Sphingobium sp.]MCI1756371.1 Arm DNA-binding domain-containing protein [Sphingobium sp.]MCI2051935.1 Arm DNA-binding domain-containing protein [Sphingobium sp.]
MATGKISKRSIDALRPNASNQFLWDTDLKGFGAKITPAGAISYVLQFRMGGREASTRRYTIGAHGSSHPPDKRVQQDALSTTSTSACGKTIAGMARGRKAKLRFRPRRGAQ